VSFSRTEISLTRDVGEQHTDVVEVGWTSAADRILGSDRHLEQSLSAVITAVSGAHRKELLLLLERSSPFLFLSSLSSNPFLLTFFLHIILVFPRLCDHEEYQNKTEMHAYCGTDMTAVVRQRLSTRGYLRRRLTKCLR